MHTSVAKLFQHFPQSPAVSLLCSVQNSKLIGQWKQKLWTNEILHSLSSIWVSDGLPILHSTQVCIQLMITMLIQHSPLIPLSVLPYITQEIDGLVQGCSNSTALAMKLLQSCTKPLRWPIAHSKCTDCVPICVCKTDLCANSIMAVQYAILCYFSPC